MLYSENIFYILLKILSLRSQTIVISCVFNGRNCRNPVLNIKMKLWKKNFAYGCLRDATCFVSCIHSSEWFVYNSLRKFFSQSSIFLHFTKTCYLGCTLSIVVADILLLLHCWVTSNSSIQTVTLHSDYPWRNRGTSYEKTRLFITWWDNRYNVITKNFKCHPIFHFHPCRVIK